MHPAGPEAPRARGIVLAICLLAGLITALARITPVFDPDYFWHLETGRWIANHRAIPTADPFSYTYPNAPWRFLDWMPELVMHLLQSSLGHGAVIVVFALAGGAGVALAIHHAAREAAPRHALALVGVAALVVPTVVFRNTPRPQTLVFVLFAGMLALLRHTRARRRAWVFVPLVIALWQNVHNSAILAWLAALATVVGDALDRRLGRLAPPASKTPWLALVGGALAMLACPHPLDRIAAGPGHLFDPRIALAFDEWAPVWRHPALPGVVCFFALLALSLTSALDDRSRPPMSRVLLAAGFAIIAARTLRFVPIGALALAPVALGGVDAILARLRAPLRAASVAALVLLAGAQLARLHRPFGLGVARGVFPERAVAFARRVGLGGNAFHQHFDGGYILWSLPDRAKLFVDGRSLQVYPADFVLESLALTDDRVARFVARHGSDWVLLPTSTTVGVFQRTPGWSLVYVDDDDFVAVRDERHPEIARRFGLRALRIVTWADDIDRLAGDASLREEARREAQRLVSQCPDAALPRVMLASVQIAAGEHADAARAVAEARRLDPDSIPARRAALVLCTRVGDRECACEAARAVLERSPRNATARAALERFRCP